MEEKLKAFIEELEKLTNKYGIEIASCGCCSSPYLLSTDSEFLVIANNLKFDKETKTYSIETTVTGSYQYDSDMYHQIGSKLVGQEEYDQLLLSELHRTDQIDLTPAEKEEFEKFLQSELQRSDQVD